MVLHISSGRRNASLHVAGLWDSSRDMGHSPDCQRAAEIFPASPFFPIVLVDALAPHRNSRAQPTKEHIYPWSAPNPSVCGDVVSCGRCVRERVCDVRAAGSQVRSQKAIGLTLSNHTTMIAQNKTATQVTQPPGLPSSASIRGRGMTRDVNVGVYVVHWLNRRGEGSSFSCPAKGRGNNIEARVCAPAISERLSVRILLLALESPQLLNCSSPKFWESVRVPFRDFLVRPLGGTHVRGHTCRGGSLYRITLVGSIWCYAELSSYHRPELMVQTKLYKSDHTTWLQ
jgi:hypothetical protein